MSHIALTVFGLICIAIFGVKSAIPPVLQEYTMKCAEKTGTTPEQVQELMKAFMTESSLNHAPHEFLCFLKCFLEEAGGLEGKKLNGNKMYELIKEVDGPITDECKKKLESLDYEIDECEDILKICI